MNRIGTAALIAVVASAAGCKDMGLEGNVPLEQAMDRPPSDLVAAVMRPVETAGIGYIMEGDLWVPSGLPSALDAENLRPVGSASGATLHAREWDEPPYDALYVRLSEVRGTGPSPDTAPVYGAGEEWLELAPVIGRADRPELGGAADPALAPPTAVTDTPRSPQPAAGDTATAAGPAGADTTRL